MNPPRFTAGELAACARREAQMRGKVYSRWIDAGRISRATAQKEIAMMEAIAERLEREAQAARPGLPGLLEAGG